MSPFGICLVFPFTCSIIFPSFTPGIVSPLAESRPAHELTLPNASSQSEIVEDMRAVHRTLRSPRSAEVGAAAASMARLLPLALVRRRDTHHKFPRLRDERRQSGSCPILTSLG